MMKMADFSDSDRSRHTADGEENDRGNFDLNLMHLYLKFTENENRCGDDHDDKGILNPCGDNHAD